MNLSQEVSSMETELASLRSEVDMRKQREAVLEWEVENLKRLLAVSTAERDTFRRRAESLKILLDQAGSTLVAGIQKFNATERELASSVDNEPLPKFLSPASKMLADTVN
jgi:predicted  nucleic acid-binding Zn-ribbon protein